MGIKQSFKAAAIAISVFGAQTASADPSQNTPNEQSCMTAYLNSPVVASPSIPPKAEDVLNNASKLGAPAVKKCTEQELKIIRSLRSIEMLLG